MSVEQSNSGDLLSIMIIVAFIALVQLLLCIKAKSVLTKLVPVGLSGISGVLFYVFAVFAWNEDALFLSLAVAYLSFIVFVTSGICFAAWAIWTAVRKKR